MSHKFPEGTVAGLYKRAIAKNPLLDAVRFDAQRFNWTLQEIDVTNNTHQNRLSESIAHDKLLYE